MILDTCGLLWLASDQKKMSRSTLKEITEAPAVYVSAISGFELALKAARGKLALPLPAQAWFDQVVENHGLTVLPLELNASIAAAQLPAIHDDPCDRFIIATAKLMDVPVVTTDGRFKEYGVKVVN